jgi:hypothetical protein
VKTKYRINQSKATPFGGLYVLDEFLHKLQFDYLFDQVFGKYRKVRNQRPVENIKLMLASIVAGGERLYDIEQFQQDPVIPNLLGLTSVPRDTTLRDDFHHLGQMHTERQELLFRLNETNFHKRNLKTITIDMDGSSLPVDGHQEGAVKGYCPEEPGSRCFQTLAAICDETETALVEKTYHGNTKWSAEDTIEFCKPMLDRFSPQLDRITVRSDSGFFSDALLNFYEAYDNVTYLIDKPIHTGFHETISQLSYKRYYNSDREYASFECQDGLNGKTRYYYVERSKIESGSQTHLFESNDYFYRVLVSNEKRQPHVMFRLYNKRGRIEKHIEELKNQYAMGKMFSGNFLLTQAFIWLSYLTFTILGMLRHVAFRHEMVRYRLRRLRYLLFTAVATFSTHARIRTLNLSFPRVTPWKFKWIMQRVWAF